MNSATSISMGSANYNGHHRANEMSRGVGLIPLGDRNRAKMEYGAEVIEERDSIDQYTKFIGRS